MPTSGLGCMRLSTEPDRDEARAIAVIHAALDAGITLIDTADAYCWTDDERGHNERLIARALASWPGDRSAVRVATKGGLTRPAGRWTPDGRAKHLAAACEASCRALGVARLQLYQLHAVDPRTPFTTSVRALASLKRQGLVESIGLCNVTVGQIEEARRIVEIDAVQVELSVWHDAAVLGGVVDYCVANRLLLLAHRPLGGPSRQSRLAHDPVLAKVAARHGATTAEIALAWLLTLSDLVVPIPGATQVDTPRSIARVRLIALADQDRAELNARFGAGALRHTQAPAVTVRRDDAEVVIVMGLPGAGKSTYAAGLIEQGHQRLNRDEAGGTLRDLVPALAAALASGTPRIVLDNTYVSRQSRAAVIRAAAAHGVSTRCVWLSTSLEEAQTNTAWRLVSRYGRLPDEVELKRLRKHDVAAFPPSVLFRYQRELEPPDVAEGFARVEIVPFERRTEPAHTNRALIVWCDDVLVRSRIGARVPLTPDDAQVLVERADVLRGYQHEGWRLLGLSWQPDIDAGSQSREGVAALFAYMNQTLGLDIEVEYCPHAAGPPRCWCRKPLPGLGVLLIQRHQLDPARCLYVGAGPQDPAFARRLGVPYEDAGHFFRRG